MTERGILMSGEMVRAILDGRKTVTRRPVQTNWLGGGWSILPPREPGVFVFAFETVWLGTMTRELRCPYGVPGDRLWVRETWADPCGAKIPVYRADEATAFKRLKWKPSIHMPRWASRITLEIVSVRPEQLREITEEDARLEGICLEDDYPKFCKECNGYGIVGSDCDHSKDCFSCSTGVGRFASPWDSINPRYPWESNPTVWRIEFRRAG